MEFEEGAAYAVAAWKRFDDTIGDELLRAVAGAFALVSASDGDLAQSEVDRFVVLIHENADMLPGLDLERVVRLFRDVSAALLTDPPAGKAQALNYVAAVKGHAQQSELVHSAAEIALVADGQSLDREHAVLQQICSTLGVVSRL